MGRSHQGFRINLLSSLELFTSHLVFKNMKAEEYGVGKAEQRPVHVLRQGVKMVLFCP